MTFQGKLACCIDACCFLRIGKHWIDSCITQNFARSCLQHEAFLGNFHAKCWRNESKKLWYKNLHTTHFNKLETTTCWFSHELRRNMNENSTLKWWFFVFISIRNIIFQPLKCLFFSIFRQAKRNLLRQLIENGKSWPNS